MNYLNFGIQSGYFFNYNSLLSFIVLFSLSIRNIYRSSALVMPAQSQGSSMSSSLSGLGGLASMAGISIPSGNSNGRSNCCFNFASIS